MVSFPRYFTVCITYQPPLVQIKTFEGYVSRICENGLDGLINGLVQSEFCLHRDNDIETWAVNLLFSGSEVLLFTVKQPGREGGHTSSPKIRSTKIDFIDVLIRHRETLCFYFASLQTICLHL